jgi:hypothetical protein
MPGECRAGERRSGSRQSRRAAQQLAAATPVTQAVVAFAPWVRPVQAVALATGETSRFCSGGEGIRRDVWLVPVQHPQTELSHQISSY